MKKGLSILDAMREAIAKGKDCEAAIVYCRARIHIPRVSAKQLRECYETAKKTPIKESLCPT